MADMIQYNWNYITGKDGKVYQEQSGVVIGSRFYSKEQFKDWFRDLMDIKYQEDWLKFREITQQARKFITLKDNKKPIMEFVSDLENVSKGFVEFTGGLGGNISLMTTFNFKDGAEQATYFLAREEDLQSSLNEIGEKTYKNTKAQLEALVDSGKNLSKLNDALVNHLNNFHNQLHKVHFYDRTVPGGIQNYQALRQWSYYNMRERFNAMSQHRGPRPTIGKYFWGKTRNEHGYTAEAYGLHLALKHPGFEENPDITLKRMEVIAEHGGPGSFELFSMLKATKGNVSSWLGGDIITIDKNGIIEYNIQSKASKRSSYGFTLNYREFLSNIVYFIDIYEKAKDPKAHKAEIEEGLEVLFEAFSATAWIEMEEKTQELVQKEAEELMEQAAKKRKSNKK